MSEEVLQQNENITGGTNKQYLDWTGVQALWNRISEFYPRTNSLVTILDALEDPYVHLSKHNTDITGLNEKIQELQASTSNSMDGDTIVLNENSKYQTNLILDIDSAKKTLRLVTKDPSSAAENPVAKTVISEIDYSPFIKDGMLNSVSLVVIPSEGEEATDDRPAGTYLKFVFNTDSGNKEPIYVNVSEFINIYKGSTYITINNDEISLNVVELDKHIESYLSSENCLTISGIKTNIQTISSNLNDINGRVELIETNYGTLSNSVKTLGETVQTFDARINNIETVLETVPTEPISVDDIQTLI